ncbi:MAG: response regulator [Cyanobacteria bacterium P01_A01_bin.84]
MDNPIPKLDRISHQLMSISRRKKQKILVVDDEPDNLDLLYRTFRRDFQVLKAESGTKALETLSTEGEVAVIISDQRMPEMKGTEFLSKTLPQFPDTVRIILTGFTDIEDLVDAINAGQVYKYITKPWDPDELKAVVQRAAETYDLLKQRTEELNRANAHIDLLRALVEVKQSASSLNSILEEIVKSFVNNFGVDSCILQLVENNTLIETQGSYSNDGIVNNWLDRDPLAQDAIATSEMQVAVNISKDPKLADIDHYGASNVQAHLAIPVVYDPKGAIALLSLQWKKPCTLREDELSLIRLSAQLVAMVISCNRQSE